MREAFGDLWTMRADAVCITTNGYVTTAGRGVMGRGVAAQAKRRFPGIDKALGEALTKNGNHVQIIAWWGDGVALVAFPVKHVWRDAADLGLIRRSCAELVVLADNPRGKAGRTWERILLPRPGCGNGRLRWEDVSPIVEPLLDDRVVIVAMPHEAPGAVRCMICGRGSVTKDKPCERCGSTWDDVQETEPDPHGWGD